MAGSTPIYGFPYPQSTDLVADYPTLGQELATDVETVISGLGSGLNLISPTSIANSGGSATSSNGVITFSSVSSVSLNGVFSATYRRYCIEINSQASTGTSQRFRFRTSGTDNSANSYYQTLSYSYGTAVGATSGTATYIESGLVTSHSGMDIIRLIVDAPNSSTQWTTGLYDSWAYQGDVSAFVQRRSGYNFQATTAFDGISLYLSAGTMSGSIRVYGYEGA